MSLTPITFAGNGVTIAGDAAGPEDGQPVLLLHGGGQTRHSWAGATAALGRQGWRAVSLDHRGHGESGWAPDGDYSIDAFASDTRAVVDQLGRPPVLVGASLGGIVSMHIAGEEPPVPAPAVVLVDVTPRLDRTGVDRIGAFMMANAEHGFGSLEEAADAIAAYRPERPRPKDLTGLRKNLRHGEDGRWRWHWDPAFIGHTSFAARAGNQAVAGENQILDEARLSAAARSLTMPVLLVRGGSSDVVSLDGVAHLRELVPHAEVVDVAGAGHMVAGDRNDPFTAAVVEFLRRTVGPT